MSLFSYVPVDVDVSSQGTRSVFDDALSDISDSEGHEHAANTFEIFEEKLVLGSDYFWLSTFGTNDATSCADNIQQNYAPAFYDYDQTQYPYGYRYTGFAPQ
jgi:ABC-type phosphate transport system substrate-binding protein